MPTAAIALGYHDVLDSNAQPDTLRRHSDRYALSRAGFRQHLRSLALPPLASRVMSVEHFTEATGCVPIFLTFDDGALGAYTSIADDLEEWNWRGHFFIVSRWIGRTGFMNGAQIRELRHRGHVIGSHSASHPERMASLPHEELHREWSESCSVLADVLGEKIEAASVPNGYHSRAVASAAAACGITVLFNSEPTASIRVADGCKIFGRYSIQAGDPLSLTGALVERSWPRLRQRALWDAKKVAKAVSGPAYLAIRTRLLSGSAEKSNPAE